MIMEELKIVRWVQHMRCVHHAMQKLFTKEQWGIIEKEAKFRVISLNEQTGKPIFINKTQFHTAITEQSDAEGKPLKNNSMVSIEP